MKKYTFLLLFTLSAALAAQVQTTFEYLDVFELEYVNNPQISPNGNYVVYERKGFDILNDKATSALWIINTNNPKDHQKLTSQTANEYQARWSPTGDRIAFVSSTEAGSELFMYWVSNGVIAKLTQLENSPLNISWSPQGDLIAFTMKVNESAPVIAKMPSKPKGAKWAEAPRITDRLKHEADGVGYLTPGYTHIFVLSAQGGTPRKLTQGPFNHNSTLSWDTQQQKIYFSGNYSPNWEYEFRNSEIYAVNIYTSIYETLTSNNGPDQSPTVSPNGKMVAYLGYEDKVQAYQNTLLHLMDIDGSNKKTISANFDHSIDKAIWAPDSNGLYIQYNELGKTKLGYITLSGKVTEIVDNLGGTTIGRPYASGDFSISNNEVIAYTISFPDRPADLAMVTKKNKDFKILTGINEDLLGFKTLGAIDEIWYNSSIDGLKLQGWILYPPNFEKRKKYPLIVENHGGPILNYGPHFSAEMQLYASAGYIVFYPNSRGSTSYGEDFANKLYHNYPGEDYNDVMDGVAEVLKRGKVDKDRLFVTGGSAGGIMTAWMIGKNNDFKAAVVAKPVVNWISKTLVADNYYGYANSRYPGQPWENVETYWKFSPISLVANIETPTMVMVGMDDLRTPPSEAKQLYHALKLQKKETVLVEIPEASHGIANRPSNLITKIAHTLAWFEKYDLKK